MGSNIYFQRTKYQKNRFDTFSLLVIFYIEVLSTAHLVTWRQIWRLVTFVATFTWNPRRTLTVKNSRQMLRAHRKWTERRRKVKNGKGEGVNWKGVDSNARCDKTRQNSFFFSKWKGTKVVQKKRGGGEKEGRGSEGGSVWSFSKVL